jgi:isoamylase
MVTGDGVNFSVDSRNATGVEILLFHGTDEVAPARVITLDPLTHHTTGSTVLVNTTRRRRA